jgi:DNA-binding transcriptional ArsR family regulator
MTHRGRPTPEPSDVPTRVGGIAAMRALAHPTRVRMMHQLREEPLSASALAVRLGIRVGSAQYHLRTLERGGIARRVGERTKRGGTEILFQVPRGLWVDLDPDAPQGLRQAMNRAYVAEVLRRMDVEASESEPDDTDRDVYSLRTVELRPQDVGPVAEAYQAFAARLDALAAAPPRDDSKTFTVSFLFFRTPGAAGR